MQNLRALLLIALAKAVFGFYFEDSYSHVYKYQATSDMIGMHNVTTVVQFRVQSVNTSLSLGPLNVLHIDSFVQFTEHGYYQENPKKWDLSKAFLFQILPSGLVDLIHVHKEDHDEVVMIKKVLASTFSANVRSFCGY
ncbi:Hypothetical predicted protein [Octopus vulgaris]|uniref:Uncharacterized protein n=1 Tax=Octopus vulgaris TaxID=6645 RepID=A0AA36BUZ8_OCTVU|nr:Hypothetical predicted protein [Octopus vulgaris]